MKKIVFFTVVFGLFLAACATTTQFTPLPWGVKITPASPALPKNITDFSGTWYGIWDNGRATTLVVEKIKPPEVSVIYSWGPLGKEREGGFSHHTGKIEAGKLTVTIQEEPKRTIIYVLSNDDERLEGEFRVAKSIFYVTMRRQPPK